MRSAYTCLLYPQKQTAGGSKFRRARQPPPTAEAGLPAKTLRLSSIAASQWRGTAANNAGEHAYLGPQLAYFLTQCLDLGITLARIIADKLTDHFDYHIVICPNAAVDQFMRPFVPRLTVGFRHACSLGRA